MRDDISYPDLVTEIHRYDKPENIYRFFTLFPNPTDHDRLNYKPFSHPALDGRPGENYVEIEREQVYTDRANQVREGLEKDGYRRLSFVELPMDLAIFVLSNQAPIEFQRGLGSGDPELVNRVCVWVRGELPMDPLLAEAMTEIIQEGRR